MSSAIDGIKSVPQTFSSWDSCMSKAYCKWPVIAAIVIASIIALSVIWCVASCLCCGATLCGACMKCLTCGNCCGACGKGSSGGGRRTRHKDDYSQMPPTPYQGYQPPPAPMNYNHINHVNHQGPHFATFDTNKKVAEDSLPAMPTWSDSRDVHVEDQTHPSHPHGDDVEMGRMHPQHRGPYDQLPEQQPLQSHYDDHYNQPYTSDLGAQRLSPHHSYHDMQPRQTVSPLSAQDAHAYESDRFAAGAISPTPNEYRGQRLLSPQQSSVSPISSGYNDHRGQHSSYASTTHSTRYEPAPEYQSYRGAASPPPSFHTEAPPLSPNSNQGYRPPSLLQAGRKPVNGYYREV